MTFALLALSCPSVHAAAAGVLAPAHGRGEDPSRHKRPVEPEDMTFPGTVSPSPDVPVRVHQLFPNDGSIFPPTAAITISWRMPDKIALPDELRINPRIFLVEMVSHTNPVTTTVRFLPFNQKRTTYHIIFNAPVSGRYGWQVTAIMDDGSIIKSLARYFIVKEPYYYNHYFDVVQDMYPHYYYDSSDHRR